MNDFSIADFDKIIEEVMERLKNIDGMTMMEHEMLISVGRVVTQEIRKRLIERKGN